MKLPFWVRKAHKWIGLVIGVQALLWMISGVYMTAISLDVIHGDHLAHVSDASLDPKTPRIDLGQIAERFPQFVKLREKKGWQGMEGTMYDVTIYWKKAYEHGNLRRNGK